MQGTSGPYDFRQFVGPRGLEALKHELTAGELWQQLWRIVWQGALMSVAVLGLFGAGVWGFYLTAWTAHPHWHEAVRHWYEPHMMVERWIRFRWIHPDSLYWIFRVRFDRGPVVLEGTPTDALYWSFTHYTGTEVNPSVSSETVALEPDGSYRITFSEEKVAGNWVQVQPGSKRGVIYFRIYEPGDLFPSRLPRIVQNGEVLTEAVLY